MQVRLYAPESYIAEGDGPHRGCNGCGPAGVFGWLVPDTVWFLSISEACNIHDRMYEEGETAEDKAIADRVFLNNIQRVDRAKGWWFLKLRMKRVHTYYCFVRDHGGSYFWDGKNQVGNLHTVEI